MFVRTLCLVGAFAFVSLNAICQPVLELRQDGLRVSVESSGTLNDWVTITNIDFSKPQQFFRAAASTNFPFTFNYEERDLARLAFTNEVYYFPVPATLPDPWPYHDTNGIRLYQHTDGVLYDHPVLQAQYGLSMFNGYYLTTNAQYLYWAELHAQYIIDKSVMSRGAMFFKYPFTWQKAPYPGTDLIPPPWWSGLAEGYALSLFVHLYELTGKQIYKDAADKTFAAFKLAPIDANTPWVMEVDPDGYLWFEEYAKDPANPQYVYNGHMFAMFGAYDYWLLTGDPDAKLLVEAGITTARKYWDYFRTPGWVIRYSRKWEIWNKNYQTTVSGEFQQLWTMTSDPLFAKGADALADDWPHYQIVSPGTLDGGITGYQFDGNGAITNSKSFTFTAPTGVTIGLRETVLNQPGTWLRVDTGNLAGFEVLEFPPQAVMNCIFEPMTYYPARKAHIRSAPTTYTFTRFDSKANVLETKSKTFTVDQASPNRPLDANIVLNFNERAIVNSRPMIKIVGGDVDGFWLPITAQVRLD
jgi:hypothetical protein